MSPSKSHSPIRTTLWAAALALIAAAAPVFAGGNVMPANANSKGYSLADLAAATAAFNTGSTADVPNVPFHVLNDDAPVAPGTTLYLPIFFVDDSGGAPDGFPTDVTNQQADAAFLDSFIMDAFGVESFIVQVDGKTTVLGDANITGAVTGPLLDGTPAGSNYVVSAAVLTPLTPGVHTIGVGGIIGGTPIVFLSYTVTVR